MRVLGVLLLILGILAVVYGGFWYTKEEQKAELGPINVSVEKKERVNLPLWAGVGAVVVGAVLMASGRRKA